MIYVRVDSPNLGFPYLYFLGGYQWKNHPLFHICPILKQEWCGSHCKQVSHLPPPEYQPLAPAKNVPYPLKSNQPNPKMSSRPRCCDSENSSEVILRIQTVILADLIEEAGVCGSFTESLLIISPMHCNVSVHICLSDVSLRQQCKS